MDEIKLALLTKADLAAQVARLETANAALAAALRSFALALEAEFAARRQEKEARAERDAAIERAEAAEAREDCSTKNGWLSDDLECGRGADPSCWKHRLEVAEAEAQGKGGH